MPPDALDIAHRKPALTIATIGSGGRSHAQFLDALSQILAQQDGANLIEFEAMLAAGREREGAQIWRSLPHIAYDSGGRHYLHYSLADDTQCLRHLITWSQQVDSLILLLNAQDGSLAQAARSLALLRQMQSPPRLLLFLDQPEAAQPAEWLTLVEDEARALITQWGYDGEAVPLIQGSIDAALRSPARDLHAPEYAPFLHLLHLIDSTVSLVPDSSRPFLLPVEDVFRVGPRRALVVTGRVARGTARRGDSVEIVGWGRETQQAIIEEFGPFLHKQETVVAGDNAGVSLTEAAPLYPQRGDVLAAPGSIQCHQRCTALLYLPRPGEWWTGAAVTPLPATTRGQLRIWMMEIAGTIRLLDGRAALLPGEAAYAALELSASVPLDLGTRVDLHTSDPRSVAVGIVTSL